MKQRVEDEGISLELIFSDKTQAQCEEICDNTENCKSFSYDPDKQKCYLKERELTGNEPQIKRWNVYTVYKYCGGYGNYQ